MSRTVEYRGEDKIKAYLDNDRSNIGEVWRYHVNGQMNEEQVANVLRVNLFTIARHVRTIKTITGEQRGLTGGRLWKDVDAFIKRNGIPSDVAEQIRERRNVDNSPSDSDIDNQPAQLSPKRSTDSDIEALFIVLETWIAVSDEGRLNFFRNEIIRAMSTSLAEGPLGPVDTRLDRFLKDVEQHRQDFQNPNRF